MIQPQATQAPTNPQALRGNKVLAGWVPHAIPKLQWILRSSWPLDTRAVAQPSLVPTPAGLELSWFPGPPSKSTFSQGALLLSTALHWIHPEFLLPSSNLSFLRPEYSPLAHHTLVRPFSHNGLPQHLAQAHVHSALVWFQEWSFTHQQLAITKHPQAPEITSVFTAKRV